MTLKEYGFDGFFVDQAIKHPEDEPARVLAQHKDRYEIMTQNGQSWAALKGGAFYNGGDESFPVTGDFVMVRGGGHISRTLDRKTVFVRRDPYVGEMTIAANFDIILIITSLNADLNIRRLERYLIAAWQSGATPVIVLTKADLADDAWGSALPVVDAAPGVETIIVSSKTGEGLDSVRALLKPGITAALLGSSGVGKSSLINALAGSELMAVREIREDDAKGRHTTTHRQLLMLDWGAMVIDTPGMRQLGLYDASDAFERTYEDIAEIERSCRFADCMHKTEPGCAVLEAIESGALTLERWEQYEKLKREARYAKRKAAHQERLRIKEKTRLDIRREGKAAARSGETEL